MKKRARGAPTKKTPERLARIVEIIAGGNFRYVAARAVGITGPTLTKWMAADPELAERVEVAEQQAEIDAVKTIRTAGDWKAMAWFLERKFPERWAQTHKQQADSTLKELQAKKLEVEIKILEQEANGRPPEAIPESEEEIARLMREKFGATEKIFDDTKTEPEPH